MLQELGFTVTKHAYGLRTSFVAEYGSGGRVVALNAEYDAFPKIGHACGHNLIATASIAAFLGVAAALKELKLPGQVRLIGTPAEEEGGGKLHIIEAGAYEAINAFLRRDRRRILQVLCKCQIQSPFYWQVSSRGGSSEG